MSLHEVPDDINSTFPPTENEACYRLARAYFSNVFACNSNATRISLSCVSTPGCQIATNFCTCHDSTAVVLCANICNDHCTQVCVKSKWISHQIWLTIERASVKWTPAHTTVRVGLQTQIWFYNHHISLETWVSLWHLGNCLYVLPNSCYTCKRLREQPCWIPNTGGVAISDDTSYRKIVPSLESA